MQEKTIQTERTARYYTNLDNSLIYNNITYCLHGYGQLAQYFTRKFSNLDKQTLIVTPEALQRFYLEGYNQRVGATWMTKEDRENDIKDYTNYLNKLHTTIKEKLSHSVNEINAIGFSQGVSTLLRWLNSTNTISFKKVYLFSGTVPEELFIKRNIVAFNKTEFHLFFDKNDQLLPHDKMKSSEQFIRNNAPHHTITYHNQGHQIPLEYLQ